jgi:cell division septation protein DedD
MIRVAILTILLAAVTFAQDAATEAQRAIDRINQGQTDAVREELPSLLAKYPNNPGVIYVQALLTKEGTEAVRMYQSIVDNFPQNEWADDALHKVQQFYYALGLYRTAELKLDQLKKEYPNSPYVQGKSESPTSAPVEEAAPTEPAPAVVIPSAGIPPTTDTVATQPDQPLQARWVLQVGAFTQQANAGKLKAFFEGLGYPVEVVSKVKDTKTLILVLVGNYSTSDAARTAAAELKQKQGIDAVVMSR